VGLIKEKGPKTLIFSNKQEREVSPLGHSEYINPGVAGSFVLGTGWRRRENYIIT